MSVVNGKPHTYQPKVKTDYVKAIKNAFKDFRSVEDNVSVSIVFGYRTANRSLIGRYKATRPDIDNLLKPVFDGLTNSIIKDDSQIVSITAIKRYAIEDYVQIEINKLGQADLYD